MIHFVRYISPAMFEYYGVYHDKGKYLGELLQHEDGFYAWWPGELVGCWPSYILLDIGFKLHKLNESWEKELAEVLSKHEI